MPAPASRKQLNSLLYLGPQFREAAAIIILYLALLISGGSCILGAGVYLLSWSALECLGAAM